MEKSDLKKLFRKAIANQYAQRGDCACKIYFFPLSSAIFTHDEYYSFMNGKETDVKPSKRQWVQEQIVERIRAILRTITVDHTAYLSVIVYGAGMDLLINFEGTELQDKTELRAA